MIVPLHTFYMFFFVLWQVSLLDDSDEDDGSNM